MCIRDRFQVGGNVAAQQHTVALILDKIKQDIQNLAAGGGVQPGGGFVQHQQPQMCIRDRVRYELTGHPLVSVMIPNKDHIDDLDRCLKSLYANAGYDNFEVLVIENNSEPVSYTHLDGYKRQEDHPADVCSDRAVHPKVHLPIIISYSIANKMRLCLL